MPSPRYCLHCDDGTPLAYGQHDLIARVGEHSERVQRVAGWHCPVCAECEFDVGEGERYASALARVRQTVNLERAASLRATRKKLGLTQAQAARQAMQGQA